MGGFPRVGDDRERSRITGEGNCLSLEEFVQVNHDKGSFRELLKNYIVRYHGVAHLPQGARECGDYLLRCVNLYEQLKAGALPGATR